MASNYFLVVLGLHLLLFTISRSGEYEEEGGRCCAVNLWYLPSCIERQNRLAKYWFRRTTIAMESISPFSRLHAPRRKNEQNVEQHRRRPVDDPAAASLLRGTQHGHIPAHVRRTGNRTAGEHLCGRMSRPRDAPRPSRQRSRRRRPFSASRRTMKRPLRSPPSFRCWRRPPSRLRRPRIAPDTIRLRSHRQPFLSTARASPSVSPISAARTPLLDGLRSRLARLAGDRNAVIVFRWEKTWPCCTSYTSSTYLPPQMTLVSTNMSVGTSS